MRRGLLLAAGNDPWANLEIELVSHSLVEIGRTDLDELEGVLAALDFENIPVFYPEQGATIENDGSFVIVGDDKFDIRFFGRDHWCANG